jgi:protocatechuate 3,4-dioxygenase beta subunit
MTRPSRRLVAVVLASVLSAPAGAQVQQPARDQPAQRALIGTGLIAGVVVSGDTGRPIADATVSVISGETAAIRVGQSDRAGRFVLPALPAGRFVLHASKPSFLGAGYGATKPGRPGTVIALADGQQLVGLNLKVWPGAVVTGLVTDEQGEPVPDAEVQLHRAGGAAPDIMQLMLAMGGGRQNVTDDRGVYRIFGIAPGEYLVSVTPPRTTPAGVRRLTPDDMAAGQRALREPRRVPPPVTAGAPSRPPPSTVLPTRPVQDQEDGQAFASSGGQSPGWAPVYSPGTTDPTRAASITLATGEERAGVNLKLEFVPLARVEGTVFGVDGRPANGVQIMLQRDGDGAPSLAILFGGRFGSRTGADGRFTVRNVTPGQYSLTATTTANQGAPAGPAFWASAPLAIAGHNILGLSLQLQPGMSVSGRVVINATRLPPPASLEGALLAVTAPSAPRDPISAMSGLVGIGFGGVNNTRPAKADGTFEVPGLPPGSYLVSGAFIRGDRPADAFTWRVASIMVDGRDVLDLPIAVKPNVDIKDVVVTFTDQQQELSGAITDAGGQPLTASTVVLFATDRRYWHRDSRRVLTARPGTDGRYEFGGLRGPTTGEYFLSVVTDLDPDQQFDPSFLDALVRASPIRLTFGPGERKTQDLRAGGK